MELNVEFMLKTFFLALSGIPVTLSITIVSLIVAAPLGFFYALSHIYKIPIIRHIVTLYVSVIRGTPIVLQILIIYSLFPSLLNVMVKQAGLNISVFDLNPIVYAYIVFSLNTTATLSEVFRSALLTVDKGQLEASLAAGLSPTQTYVRIIIPQALVSALPNICNLVINLIKSTSLAFIMTVKDITAVAKIAAARGYNYIEAYLDIFVIYIMICGVTQIMFTLAEKYFSKYRKG
ncbi:MAG: amino acid ABC transporter permease [Treponema sp.]|jgi:L-cystine transport system permease protein|nr:amino acid ABC transporter permease [Treponema sp.]